MHTNKIKGKGEEGNGGGRGNTYSRNNVTSVRCVHVYPRFSASLLGVPRRLLNGTHILWWECKISRLTLLYGYRTVPPSLVLGTALGTALAVAAYAETS